jgi:hypothetical protein
MEVATALATERNSGTLAGWRCVNFGQIVPNRKVQFCLTGLGGPDA